MSRIAGALSDDDARAAALYFSALQPRVWTKVVETDEAPETYVGFNAMRYVKLGGEKEPIGNRIVTVPSDESLVKNRDPHTGFIDYVPRGSVARGAALVKTGDGDRTIPCATCHGVALGGLGDAPKIVGLPLIYVFRQLNDIRRGVRTGMAETMMHPVVQKLTSEDMVAIAAYLGSQRP
jgi:cytochrome c553